jgi:Cdc6-like AAA superfamily ATPase
MPPPAKPDALSHLPKDFVQLARLAMTGRPQDVQIFIRRLARRYRGTLPELAAPLNGLLRESPSRDSPLRKSDAAALPVDLDTRFQLLRYEATPTVDVEPVFPRALMDALLHLLHERQQRDRLEEAGLSPTRSILFTGPPGVGKSLTAHWLAAQLGVPLLTLDLSAVMSSYLGRTGTNVRHVLDYAKGMDCVLLLDEFDAVAKRRDDTAEIGELKRLVTVLLQEIDDWPSTGLLIAATNHPNLLDPAVWRRFEIVLEFPLPTREEVAGAIRQWLPAVSSHVISALGILFEGKSFSDAERQVMLARRAAIMQNQPVESYVKTLFRDRISRLAKRDRQEIAVQLVDGGVSSQREAHELTGVSRDTIRKSKMKPESKLELSHA